MTKLKSIIEKLGKKNELVKITSVKDALDLIARYADEMPQSQDKKAIEIEDHVNAIMRLVK